MGTPPISWAEVAPGSVLMGSDDRSILFGGIGPRHEVSIGYRYKISMEPLEPNDAEDILNSQVAEIASESEWELAYSMGLISGGDGNSVEALADLSENYWGKACDGRPIVKKGSRNGIIRVWKSGKPTPSMMPIEKIQSSENSIKFRLVVRELTEWPNSPLLLPKRRDNSRIFREEAIISIFFGIIPSFAWAFFNASPTYISEGWLNLLFGGIFFGLFTGIFWRPRQPTWYVESGEMVRRP